jgi:hypothetical protein
MCGKPEEASAALAHTCRCESITLVDMADAMVDKQRDEAVMNAILFLRRGFNLTRSLISSHSSHKPFQSRQHERKVRRGKGRGLVEVERPKSGTTDVTERKQKRILRTRKCHSLSVLDHEN